MSIFHLRKSLGLFGYISSCWQIPDRPCIKSSFPLSSKFENERTLLSSVFKPETKPTNTHTFMLELIKQKHTVRIYSQVWSPMLNSMNELQNYTLTWKKNIRIQLLFFKTAWFVANINAVVLFDQWIYQCEWDWELHWPLSTLSLCCCRMSTNLKRRLASHQRWLYRCMANGAMSSILFKKFTIDTVPVEISKLRVVSDVTWLPVRLSLGRAHSYFWIRLTFFWIESWKKLKSWCFDPFFYCIRHSFKF